MEPVTWGVLSTARINRLLLAAARASDRARFVAVASRDADRAAAYARSHELDRAYGAYDALLTDPEVEAVYISLPNALHVPWAMEALSAGKHVLCEKPLSRDPAAVAAAFDLAERNGLVLAEAFMFRHHPQTRRLAQLVAAGAIGALKLVRATLTFAMDDASADFRNAPELEGGALMDVGAYCVSAARLLAGEPERAYAEATTGRGGTDVNVVGTLRFPGDVLAHFDAAMVLPRRDALEVVGTDGTIVLSDPWHGRGGTLTITREMAGDTEATIAADPYRLQLEDFADAVRGVAPPLLGRNDAVGQAAALEALHRAIVEGAPQRPTRPTLRVDA